jgi:dipeptidyl aminopeptidase/acylaminoacyl peptidase
VDRDQATSYPYARFLNARRCYGPSFSPDGSRVAFISDISGVPEAWAVSAHGGWPEQLTYVGDRVGFVSFAPRRDDLLIGTDVGGDENVQLALLSSRGERHEALTFAPSAMHPFGDWAADGRQIAYASNERERAYLDVIVQDVVTGEAQTVLETDGMYSVECFAPDGRRLIVSRNDSSFNNDLFELDLSAPEPRLLTQHVGPVRYEQPTYRADGRSVLVITDQGRDFLGIASLDIGSGAWTPIVEDAWDVESFSLAPDGRSIAFARNVEGYSEVSILDLGTSLRVTLDLPRGVVARSFVGNWRDRIAWSPDGRRLAFSLTSPTTTQNVWLADPATGAAWPLTHATIGAIPSDDLVEPELVHYATFDGRSIPAFLYRSRNGAESGSAPAVVYIHGGPESQSRPAFDATIQYLAGQGYVVLVPNVRGSTGYGKAYSHLDDVERRMDAVADAKAGADWLASSGAAHPRKIAAMGGSYGGFMVLASLAAYPETWAAGVDLYGVANFVTLLQTTHPFRRKHREAEYGSLERDRAVLEQISPLKHLDRIVAPLFVAHGENDIRVPMSETEQVVSALRGRGVPVEFVRLPHEGHGFVRLENKLTVYPAIAVFLDRYLR